MDVLLPMLFALMTAATSSCCLASAHARWRDREFGRSLVDLASAGALFVTAAIIIGSVLP